MTDNRRTDYTIDIAFVGDEEVPVKLPYEILVRAAQSFCNVEYDVKIEGTPLSIWNLLGTTNFFEELLEDDDYHDIVEMLYRDTKYFDEDFERWVER